MLLKQVAKRQDLCLIRDLVTDEINPYKAAHGRHFDQSVFHCWNAEDVPLLHKVNAHHGRQGIWRTAALAAGH